MSTLVTAQYPIDTAIIEGMITSTPAEWEQITLELRREVPAPPDGAFAHALVSPQGFASVEPEPELYAATARLYQFLHGRGRLQLLAVYRAQLIDEKWEWEAEFEYPE